MCIYHNLKKVIAANSCSPYLISRLFLSPLQLSCSGQGHLDMYVYKSSKHLPFLPHLSWQKHSALFLRYSALLVSMTPYSPVFCCNCSLLRAPGLGGRFKGPSVLSWTISLLSVYTLFFVQGKSSTFVILSVSSLVPTFSLNFKVPHSTAYLASPFLRFMGTLHLTRSKWNS